GYGHIEDFLQGVPSSGLYDIEVLVEAMHRRTYYDPKLFRIDLTEPFQIAIVPGDVRKGHIHYPQSVEPILGQQVVPERQRWLKFRVWLDAGQTPRFIFPNGPYESRASVIATNEKYRDEFSKPERANGVGRTMLLLEGELPHIRIDEIKIHGPLKEPGGGREERAVFGEDGFDEAAALQQVQAFASRAYRRPLNDNDKQRLQRLFDRRIREGASRRTAALDTIKLVLCSPSFLFLREITAASSDALGPHDLATRLSYALWSQSPDDTLRRLADDGSIMRPEVLSKQIDRLLDDPRSDAFVRGFLDAWLALRDLGNAPPPRQSNRDYYAKALPDSMRREAALFFRHLMKTDGTVGQFLDADFTFVDKNLAQFYRLPEGKTLRLKDGFVKVPLRQDSHRGGLLGMAAVLTVSANGVETSPITRGVWVLENLLGDHLPPPPDEVPEIESNIQGAKTIRERIQRHRADPACSICHRKIDPHGFALEAYDPIGRFRKTYPGGKSKEKQIDRSGELPTGETYKDVRQFKQVLQKHRGRAFRRHLIASLLAYTTGRGMTATDRFTIDDIDQQCQSNDHGLRSILRTVLTSKAFRSP
ncbi:MAG: DUF1592 domain-containing protein, partial [Planctomycetota bacterium]